MLIAALYSGALFFALWAIGSPMIMVGELIIRRDEYNSGMASAVRDAVISFVRSTVIASVLLGSAVYFQYA